MRRVLSIERISTESFDTSIDLGFAFPTAMRTRDVGDLAKEFSKRTVANGQIIFGLRRSKRLKALIHWVQDFKRVSKKPTIAGLNRDDFVRAFTVAAERNDVRKAQSEASESTSWEASPGKLKDEKSWPEWEAALVNYLSTIQGSFGIPLLPYVVREHKNPRPEEVDGDDNFITQCIMCAPLKGTHFEADKRAVHQILHGLVQGESAEDWIKPMKLHNDGRRDMRALRSHYEGKGNSSRHIAVAERFRENLHYKSERPMKFETFLSHAQKMFTIFGEEDEEYSDDAKLQWLFTKGIQHAGLVATVAALKAQRAVDSESVSYTTAVNQLAAEVSTLPETLTLKSRGIGAIASNLQGGRDGGSIYASDGSIHPGYYKNWGGLSQEERDKVQDERKRLGKNTNGGRGRRKTAPKTSARTDKKLKQKVAKMKGTVSAFRKKKRDANESLDEGDEDSDNTTVADDAGNQFGGHQAKKSRKKKSKSA